MGTSSSKLVKKVLTPSGNKGSRERQDETKNPHYSRSGTSFDDIRPKKAIKRTNSITSIDPEVDMITASLNLPPGIGPVVLYRQGSMYFDEDGDLAHEFYAEVNNGGKSKMIRVYENLHPQGKVRLPHPMLRSDCPVILHVL